MGLLFKPTIALAKGVTKAIYFIITGVVASNFISTTLSRFVEKWIYNFEISLISPKETGGLGYLYVIAFQNLISNQYSLITGILGVFILGPIAHLKGHIDAV